MRERDRERERDDDDAKANLLVDVNSWQAYVEPDTYRLSLHYHVLVDLLTASATFSFRWERVLDL